MSKYLQGYSSPVADNEYWYSVTYDYAYRPRHDYYIDTSKQSVKRRLLGSRSSAQNIRILKLKGSPPPYVMRYLRGKLVRVEP